MVRVSWNLNWYGVPSSLLEMNPRAKEEEQKERQKILEKFTIGPFEDIVARSEAKVCTDPIRIFRLMYMYMCVCVFPLPGNCSGLKTYYF